MEAAGRCKISVCLFQAVWCHTVREFGLVLVTDCHIVLIPVQEGLDFLCGMCGIVKLLCEYLYCVSLDIFVYDNH